MCPLEISLIDVKRNLGFTYYVTDKCELCCEADIDNSEYLFYMRNFKIISDRAILKKESLYKKIERQSISLRNTDIKYNLFWTWFINYSITDVDIFLS